MTRRLLLALLLLGATARASAQDATPPAGPTNLATASHANAVNQWHKPQSADNTVEVTWTAATDGGSGLDGYGVVWDQAAATVPAAKNVGAVVAATSPALANGNDHWVHVRAVDKAGNWGTAVHLGPFFIDTVAPTVDSSSAEPGNLEAGTVEIVVVFREQHSGMAQAVNPRVQVQTPNRLLAATQTAWDAAGRTWRGTVTVDRTLDGDGDATVRISLAEDRAGNVMVAVNGAQFHINRGRPGPPVASNQLMHNVGVPHSAGGAAPAWSFVHAGDDYHDAVGVDVVATRSGTVINGGGAGANVNAVVRVDVGAGTELDSYNHLQVLTFNGAPPVDAFGAAITVRAGAKLGEIGAGAFFGADTHTHWNRDAAGVAVENLNALAIFTNNAHRDPAGNRPRLEDQTADGRALTFFTDGFGDGTAAGAGAPFLTPGSPIYGKVRIGAEAVDYTGFHVPVIPYEVGYWVEPRLTAGRAVRSAAAPYVLIRFDRLHFNFQAPQPSLYSYNAAHRRNYAGYTWQRYPLIWVSNATAVTGAPADISAAERWHTKARAGTGAKPNGGDAADARDIDEAAFADGTYLAHVMAADLGGPRQDLIDTNAAGAPVEITVDNFAPVLKKLVIEQDNRKRYEATWSYAGGAGTLNPPALNQRNLSWINAKGDVLVRATFSEPMRLGADAPKLRLKDNNNAIQGYELAVVPDTKQRVFTVAIPEGHFKTHLFDSDSRQFAFLAKDLAGNDLDSEPASAAVRDNTAAGAWQGYQHAPNADWAGAVVDLTHRVQIDTKHDQKAEPERPH